MKKTLLLATMFITTSLSLGNDFGMIAPDMDLLLNTPRVNRHSDQSKVVQQFQVQLLKSLFLKHFMNDEFSFLTEEEQADMPGFSEIMQQRDIMMDALAKHLAKQDILQLEDHIRKGLQTEPQRRQY